jgi:uncharacterized membrane protein YdjX (TVP38/TMEM64 family)
MKKFEMLLIFLFFLLLIYLLFILYPYNKEHVLEIVKKTKGFAPIVLVLLHSFQVIVAPVPGHFFPFLMGFLYGAYAGSIMAIIGNFTGSLIGFFIGKFFGNKLGIKRFEKFEKYRERILNKSVLWLIILFIAPIPGIPKDLLCFFAGFLKVKTKDFFLSLIFGRAPIEILWVLAGSGIFKYFLPQ